MHDSYVHLCIYRSIPTHCTLFSAKRTPHVRRYSKHAVSEDFAPGYLGRWFGAMR